MLKNTDGLPAQPSRRAMLGKIPAAAIAAASAGAVSYAQSAPLAVTAKGNPELIALYAELKQAERDFVVADSAVKAARPVYEQSVPPIPKELSPEADDKLWFLSSPVSDVEGGYVKRGTEKYVLTSKGLKSGAEDYGPRSKLGRLIRERIDVALDYERQVNDVVERTGIRKAVEARKNAHNQVDEFAKKMADIPAHTEQDLFIKASSILACETVGCGSEIVALVRIGPDLMKNLTAVLRGFSPTTV